MTPVQPQQTGIVIYIDNKIWRKSVNKLFNELMTRLFIEELGYTGSVNNLHLTVQLRNILITTGSHFSAQQ